MNYRNIILILIVFCSNFIYSQLDKITRDKFKDLVVLLPEGNHEVQIMDAYPDNPRYYELFHIIDSTFMDNLEWADEYFKNIDDYGPFKFDPKFGLTKEEFDEYLKLDEQHGLISSGSEKLEIVYDKSQQLITFKGEEKIELLNKIVIDLNNEKMYYDDLELKYSNEEYIPKNQSSLNTDIKGYVWSLLNTPDRTRTYDGYDEDINYHNIWFSIGQLKNNGKTSISIFEIIEHAKGICMTSRYDLLIMF